MFRQVAAAVAVAAILTAPGLPAAPLETPGVDPPVTVIVHVMLAVPHALPGTPGEWYCQRPRRAYSTPLPQTLLAGYERGSRLSGMAMRRRGPRPASGL